MHLLEALLALLVCSLSSIGVSSSKVHTDYGTIIGKTVERPAGKVNQFLGVPYAQPPIENLRFKPPQELTKTKAKIDATSFKPPCYQPPHLKEVINPLLSLSDLEVSEDCLFLNIYVPQIDDNTPLSVMVWLPGEGFDYSDANHFDGSYLASFGKVIVVTVQYRVSVFGFLSTGTKEAPGNAGLLDQRLALKWIKNNIGAFKGDPNNVTLFGRFSGAMSVSMHYTSPLNIQEPLFQRIILQSGVATGNWIFDYAPMKATMILANEVGCKNGSTEDIVSCLQSVPANILLTNSFYVPQRFRPVFDGTFLEKDPLDSLKEGKHCKVDALLGHNKDEGTICMLSHYAMKTSEYDKIIQNDLNEQGFDALLTNDLKDFYKESDILVSKLTSHEYFYLENPEEIRNKYSRFCGDLYIISRMEQFARVLAASDAVKSFMYQFDYRPSFSLHPKYLDAGHGDDIFFSLGLVHKLENLKEEEKRLSFQTLSAISNFAKNGNPSFEGLEWPSFTESEFPVMHFSAEHNESKIIMSEHDRAVAFWYDLLPQVMNLRKDTPSQNRDLSTSLIDHVWSNKSHEAMIFTLLCISGLLVALLLVSIKFYHSKGKALSFRKL